jgi:hypothetical protein
MVLRLSWLIRILGVGFFVAPLLAGCSGESPASPTPTAMPSIAATASQDIRRIDLADQPDVKEFAQSVGGQVAPEEVIYADLTSDGIVDAVVPNSSRGTQGDIAFIVIGYVDGQLTNLFSDAPPGGEVRVSVESQMLVEALPVYSPGDQPHFPSHVKKIYYVWKGDGFVEDHEEEVTGQFPSA